jgi:hypothetical protein
MHISRNALGDSSSQKQTDRLQASLKIFHLCRELNPSTAELEQLLRDPLTNTGINYLDGSNRSPLAEGEHMQFLVLQFPILSPHETLFQVFDSHALTFTGLNFIHLIQNSFILQPRREVMSIFSRCSFRPEPMLTVFHASQSCAPPKLPRILRFILL